MKIRTIVLDSGAERYLDYAKKRLLELNRRRQFYGQSFSKDVVKIGGTVAYLFCSDSQLSLILKGGGIWLYPWFVLSDRYGFWYRFLGYYNDTKTYDFQVLFSTSELFGGVEFENGLVYYAKSIRNPDASVTAEIHTVDPETEEDLTVFSSEPIISPAPTSGYIVSGLSFTKDFRYITLASMVIDLTSFVRVYTSKWEFVRDLIITPPMTSVNGMRASENGVVVIGTNTDGRFSRVVIFDKNGQIKTDFDLSPFGGDAAIAAAADKEKFYVRALSGPYAPVYYYMWDKNGKFLGKLREGTWDDDSTNGPVGLMQWDKYGNAEINLIDTADYPSNAEVRIEQAGKTRVSEHPAPGWYFAHCFIGKDYKTPGTQAFIGAANLQE